MATVDGPERLAIPRGTGARTTKRRGRVPAGAHQTLAALGPRWSVPGSPPWSKALLDEAFGCDAPRLLDIGCGNGLATRAWALAHPDQDIVAVELHRPGLVRLLRDLDDDGPGNVRVVEHDALALLETMERGAFTQVRVLFPDPWPKRRHRDRRMVDPAFVGTVTDLLPAGGLFHVATDWADYAEQIRGAVDAEPRLVPVTDHGGEAWDSARPDRPITAYEQRALDAGRVVTDLVARRVDDAVAAPPLPSPST